MYSRRNFLQFVAGAGAAYGAAGLLPAWARSASEGNLGLPALTGTEFDLTIGRFPVRIDGRMTEAIGVNGSVPAPLLRLQEGAEVTLRVTNTLTEDTSIHWHGLLVPFHMDGVPGVSFPGIKPGETFTYRFAVPQNGTYWYHSHSGLQEQLGHYGPIIIDPGDAEPVQYDREYVLMLGDWTFASPYRIFSKLKKNAESLNFQQRTLGDLVNDAARRGLAATLEDRATWGAMRMSPRDIADVGGATYTYVINGRSTADNFDVAFVPGERVRLRIINASAMTLFNVRIPGLPMTVVQADGLNVQPLEIDEFQIGVAETYDVIVNPEEERSYAFVAESIDRSGQAVATLATRPGARAEAPKLRPVPLLGMKDMGMNHGAMAAGGGPKNGMGHGPNGHGSMVMSEADGGEAHLGSLEADIERGPEVANVAAMPASRLDEPGIGLENVPHRTLRYADLRSLEPNPDTRRPGREVVVHLTGNMERYMWSFDGVRFSEVDKPIVFHEGERVRLTMINDTMMPHPVHLHGMFFDLVNGGGNHRPRKHTVVVKPGEKLSADVTAEHVGDWAFHCHLLYHLHAGMMQVVSVLPASGTSTPAGHRPGTGQPPHHPSTEHGAMPHGGTNS